jgi:serine/threonine protein kinase
LPLVLYASFCLQNNSSARSVASCAADVFSLGIMLFEMATQTELPLSGPLWISLRQGGGRDLLHGRVSATLEHWIMRMMDPSPVTRPTALDVVTAALWPLPVPLTLHQ